MYFERHYTILNFNEPNLVRQLEEEYGIQVSTLGIGKPSIVFDVHDNHPQFPEIESILPLETPPQKYTRENILTEDCNSTVMIIYTPIYSEEERRSAPWLDVRSKAGKVKSPDGFRCGKQCILPERPDWRNAVHWVYDDTFEIGPPVKWGRNAIAGSEWCDTMLFCSERTKRILSAENLRGLQFEPVHSKKRAEPMPDVFRLNSTFEIPDDSFVGLSYCRDYVCPVCGMKMLMPDDGRQLYAIKKGKLAPIVDVYNSLPLFLGNCGDNEPVGGLSHLIISQRFYRVLVDNQLDRALEFTPLQEI